jgi:hypothetical protein
MGILKKNTKEENFMSGTSYDQVCPWCGGKMMCSSDYKPHESVAGECLDCGYIYYTESQTNTLAEVNERRKDFGYRKIKKLKKQTNEPW